MHTISKKLAKREKRARFPHERARKIFWSRFGVYCSVIMPIEAWLHRRTLYTTTRTDHSFSYSY